jgi:hypothetical protein
LFLYKRCFGIALVIYFGFALITDFGVAIITGFGTMSFFENLSKPANNCKDRNGTFGLKC